MKNSLWECQGFSFDWESNLEKIKTKKLKEMLKEALEIQKKLKKILISNFKEAEEEKNDDTLKKILKWIKKLFKKQEENDILCIISKKDWKKMKDNIEDDSEEFYNFIRNMTFEFIEVLEREVSIREKIKELKWKVKADVTKKI